MVHQMNNACVSVSHPHYSLCANDCEGILLLINTFSSPEKHKQSHLFCLMFREKRNWCNVPDTSVHSEQRVISEPFPHWSLLFHPFLHPFGEIYCVLALEYVAVLTLLGEK